MIISNCRYIDWKSLEISECSLLVEAGNGGGVKKLGADEKASGEIVDAKGRIVTRAFGCGHHHIYSALARGMPAPQKSPANFAEILKYIWWVLDRSLDEQMIRSSAEAAALDLIRNGASLVIDHHSSPSSCSGSLDIIHEVFSGIGLNHVLCYEMSDRDGGAASADGLAESEAYLKSGNPALVGLHASFTVGNDLLASAVDLAGRYGSGIHMHAAEDKYDSEHCRSTYGKKLMERLKPAIALNKSIMAHCLHLDNEEREMLSASSAWIVQNPDSNLNNAVGFLKTEGIDGKLMYGTDGMHSNMIKSAQRAYFTGNTIERISPETAYARFRNIHSYIDSAFPGLEGDNNLVILDYPSPTPVQSGNIAGHFIYGLEGRHVASTIINGRLVYHNGQFAYIDENEIYTRSREQTTRLWRQMDRTGVHE